ncbi:MAG: hypothetical protein IPM57_04710 [Oligoflexia bacterium]|nr:hypothetical protein [Oligoflexia bacterium]
MSLVAPTTITGPTFLRIQEKDALRITISKNSPPLAALSDEVLAQVSIEPVEEIKIDKNSVEISVGNKNYWPTLKKYSDEFEKEQKRRIEIIEQNAQEIKNPKTIIASDGDFKISKLVRLVEPVKETYQRNIVAQQDTRRQKLKNENPIHIQALDGEVLKETTSIMGQVEFTGGLALVENTNSLRVFWKTALNEKDADLDSSSGKFLIQVPNANVGKLQAHLYDSSKNIIGIGSVDLTEYSELNQLIKLVVEPVESSKGGQVISAYSFDKYKVNVPGAEVFGPALTREAADYKGVYKLAQLGGSSTHVLLALAPDHWQTLKIVDTAIKQTISLFPNKMLQNFFEIINQQENSSEYGVIWGKALKRGGPLSGVEVKLSEYSQAVGPIYFNELFLPDKNLTKTSSNGMFAFVKVNKGLHVLYSKLDKNLLPSTVITVAPSTVSQVDIQAKSIEVAGSIVDPVFNHGLNAKGSIIGLDGEFGIDANNGFKFKIPSQDAVIYFNFDLGPEFYLTRASVARSLAKNTVAFAIRKAWLDEELKKTPIKQSPKLGLVFGEITGNQFVVTLDNERVLDENIFYFNEKNEIAVSKDESNLNGGRFLITNVEPGLHTLLVTSSDGQITNTKLFIAEAGSASTFSFALKR